MAAKQPKPYENPYWAMSKGPLYSLVFVLPMLIAFEVHFVLHGTSLIALQDMQTFFNCFNTTTTHFSAILVVMVLLIWQWFTGDTWKIRFEAIVMMIIESAFYGLVLLGVAMLSQKALAASTVPAAQETTLSAAIFARMGAGIYEEFFFRLAAFNILSLLLHNVMKLKDSHGNIIILIVSSLLFAWRHFPGDIAIVWPKLLFYAVCGVYLGCIYLGRGFGLSVGAHVFYNIYVTMLEYS